MDSAALSSMGAAVRGSMRRIVMFNNVSADGYFASPDGSLGWVSPDPELDRAAMSGPRKIDTVLFGRRTYDLFAAFWPYALSDKPVSPDPHNPRRMTPEMRSMAVFLNDANKVVFSKTIKDVSWKNTQVEREFDPRMIKELKQGTGEDMIIFGSGTIVTSLTQNKLIDEYQFIVRPVILGSGKSLLSGISANLKLKLEEAKRYPSGSVMLRYVLAPEA